MLGLLMGAIGALVGYAVAKWFGGGTSEVEAATLPIGYKLSILGVIPFAFLVTLALHELGHVIGGLLVGFEFRMYTVGPFMIEREAGKLNFKWNKNLNTFGGLALCLPLNDRDLARRFTVFVAGGPLGSLVWALAAWGLWSALSVPDLPGFWLHVADMFLFLSILFSGFIFLTTIFPMHSGGFYSDGARIGQFLRKGPDADLQITLLTASAWSLSGTRPRDIDPNLLLKGLEIPTDSPFKGYFHGFLHYIYLDRGDWERAEYHLLQYETYLEHIPEGYQATVWLDKAYFWAMYYGDAVSAQAFLDNAEIGAAITPSKVLRTEAAIAHAKGDRELAATKAAQALKELPRSMDKGQAVAEKEWLEKMIVSEKSLI